MNSEEVEDGCVHIVHVDGIFSGEGPEIVGRTVDGAGARTAAGEPHGETAGVVVASDAFLFCDVVVVAGWGSSELAAPDDKGVFEHAALGEVGEEGVKGLVASGGEFAMAFIVEIVSIPSVVKDLDESDSAFDEAAREEELLALLGVSVEFADGSGFAREVECVGGLDLHPEGGFEGSDAAFEQGVSGVLGGEVVVEGAEKIELAALFAQGGGTAADVLNHARQFGIFGRDSCARAPSGQEGVVPLFAAAGGGTVWGEGDEAGKVLIFGPEAIKNPRTHAGADARKLARGHDELRGFVHGSFGVHG